MKTLATEIDDTHLFAIKLMKNLIVPTFVLDAEGQVIIWNIACERLTGIKAGELIGTRDHWRAFYEEPRHCLADLLVFGNLEQLDSLYATYSELGEAHEGLRAENWCVMPLAETQLYLAIDAGPIYNEDGKLIAVVETLRDMTAQIQAVDALTSLANQDGLTGIGNRRAFDLALNKHFQLAQQGKTPIALILGDIDHFKAYNDLYGHQKGDECLTTIAKTMDNNAGRCADITARYGGEEFAIILPGVGLDRAIEVAESIRKSIFDLNISHLGSKTCNRITMSLGIVSIIPDVMMEMKHLIHMADLALYQGKDAGRNQVAVANLKE
ncbi:MAG: sensor domain-containing diguanylate cyclase [Pseudomonadota bacterium]